MTSRSRRNSMETTARTTNSTTTRPGNTGARRRASARAREDEVARDEYDLLTAALLGALVGAGVTMLFRRGPKGYRPVGPIMRTTGRRSEEHTSELQSLAYLVCRLL